MNEANPVFSSSELSEQGARLLARNDGCAVWQFRNESGDGTMTVYDVFPGVMLSFNDFHMSHYESAYVARRRFLPSITAGRDVWNTPPEPTPWPTQAPET